MIGGSLPEYPNSLKCPNFAEVLAQETVASKRERDYRAAARKRAVASDSMHYHIPDDLTATPELSGSVSDPAGRIPPPEAR